MKSTSGKLKISAMAILLVMLIHSQLVDAGDKSIKILLLGDSITQADSKRASFR